MLHIDFEIELILEIRISVTFLDRNIIFQTNWESVN